MITGKRARSFDAVVNMIMMDGLVERGSPYKGNHCSSFEEMELRKADPKYARVHDTYCRLN